MGEWLSQTHPNRVVDIGCGTGRLLDFAMTGLDPSSEMLKVARAKFPDRLLIQQGLPEVGLTLESKVDRAICFHVFMHLDEQIIRQSFAEIRSLVNIGGSFIFDIPSRDRRQVLLRPASSLIWHGGTAATDLDIREWIGPHWHLVERRGLLFFPIHRLPSFVRDWFYGIDRLIGKTALSRYSSYHVYRIERVS